MTGTPDTSAQRELWLPRPYPPGVSSFQDLQPIMTSQLAPTREGHRHRGRRMTLQVQKNPRRDTTVDAMAQDEQGGWILLRTYQQPEEEAVRAKNVLHYEGVYILKEPFVQRITINGLQVLTVSVHHVSDIEKLSDTDSRVPLAFRKPATENRQTSTELRMIGNKAVEKKQWDTAEIMYSSAIQAADTAEEKDLARLNRSLANLRLGRAQKAFDDATIIFPSGSPRQEMALFRQAKALYDIGKFEEALERIEAMLAAFPSKHGELERGRLKKRLREKATGEYDFTDIYRQAQKTPPVIDCATFVGPVAVRASPGKGNGLFTTAPVKAGQLLLAEKAFAYTYVGDDHPVGRRNQTVLIHPARGGGRSSNLETNKTGVAHLIVQVAQKLHHDKEAGKVFEGLYRNGYQAPPVAEVDGSPVIDTFMIRETLYGSGLSIPRCSKSLFLRDARQGGPASAVGCGIWPIGSRLNNSCLINCRRSFFGDMVFLRATQNLQADVELLADMVKLVEHKSYDETQKEHPGFVYDCDLCAEKKQVTETTRKKRAALAKTMCNYISNNGTITSLLVSAASTYKEILSAYDSENGRLRWELAAIHKEAVMINGSLKDPIWAVSTLIKALKELGFSVEARHAAHKSGDGACPAADNCILMIHQWGIVRDSCIWIFDMLYVLYEALGAPELCVAAKEYARTSYAIWVGEHDVTFEDFFRAKAETCREGFRANDQLRDKLGRLQVCRDYRGPKGLSRSNKNKITRITKGLDQAWD